MKTKTLILSILFLATIASACGSAAGETIAIPEPPDPPTQAELEEDLKDFPWWWTNYQVLYAIQNYCAYSDDCDTEHVWLGKDWGYGFPSYQTIVFGESIRIADIYVIHVAYEYPCPEDWLALGTDANITGHGVFNAEGKWIPLFCIESNQ